MFAKIESFFDHWFAPVKPVPAGIYQYQAPQNAPLPYKLHLRIDADGSGILIINASTVLHLNRTAAECAYYLVNGEDQKKIALKISERYEVSKDEAQKDLDEFLGKIDTLVHTEDLDPVTYLGMERVSPYSQKLTAPYRLDCALTYRVSDGTDKSVAPTERVSRELETQEWVTIMKKAWEAGIPQVVFTGGEPTLRADLPQLITAAEEIGLVSGLLTDGFKLAEKKYALELLQKGLDHIMLLANPDDKRFWKALKNLIPQDIAVSVHATLTHANQAGFSALLEKLAREGVTTISLSAEDDSLAEELAKAGQKASELRLSQVWDLPVPYSNCHPLALELAGGGNKVPQGAGKAWLYVEPDGDVLPAQGVNKVLGNMLKDPWQKIYKRH